MEWTAEGERKNNYAENTLERNSKNLSLSLQSKSGQIGPNDELKKGNMKDNYAENTLERNSKNLSLSLQSKSGQIDPNDELKKRKYER